MTLRARGVLWVSPPAAAGIAPETRILGVPLARRVAVAAERAGFARILFADAPGLAKALAGTRAEVVPRNGTRGEVVPRNGTRGEVVPRNGTREEVVPRNGTRAKVVPRVGPPRPPTGPARLVILRSGVVPSSGWLRALLAAPPARREPSDTPAEARASAVSASVVVVDVPRADEVVDRLGRSGAAWLAAGSIPEASPVDWPGPARPGGMVELATAADLPAAERRLLQGLVKDTEGFFSRHLNRRISLAVTRRLARTRMTPNAMTAVSVAVGLAGAVFFTSGEARFQFVGALLFLLHSILDGCDGELARLKFQESRLGGVLDFWGDNVVHCAVFAALAAGWSRDAADPRPLAAGVLAIAGTLLSAGFVARYAMGSAGAGAAGAEGAAEGPQFTSVTPRAATRLSRFADMLARRDFIYLVVLLSAFGQARWFLALAAVGAPLFFLTLLVIEASGRRRLGRDLP